MRRLEKLKWKTRKIRSFEKKEENSMWKIRTPVAHIIRIEIRSGSN